jgi:2-oxoglutarate ferredoxin oxidoreductase subunit delta
MVSISGLTMVMIKIDALRCKGCGLCVGVCPNQVIKMSDETNSKGHKFAQITEQDKCTACGMCFLMCPDVVIEIEK